MADDWEDDDWESTPTPAPVAGIGGAAAAAPDDWEDEDIVPELEPVVAAAAKKESAPTKQSKRIALALKQKEKEEQAAAAARAIARQKEMAEMSDVARKVEMQRLVEESDLDNARDLFMGPGRGSGRGPPAEENLHTLMPVTDAELAKYALMLSDKCKKFNKDPRRTARYMVFVKEVMRGLTADLNADDAKEIATHMGTLSNVKLEAFKKAKGGKKKTSKKTNVRVGLDRADNIRDDSYGEGYDDFM